MLRGKFIALYTSIRNKKRSQINNQETRKKNSRINLKQAEENDGAKINKIENRKIK